MNFNDHSNLEGLHAFLGASQYHWVNYSDEKLIEIWNTHYAAERGTRLHELAKELILLGEKLPKKNRTLNLYVNDAIGFHLKPEQVLYYSPNCFGTADAIDFNEKKGFLRIHDLKTGVKPAKMTQLYIYAAIFCLEYDIKPSDIQTETRIYQFNEFIIDNPTFEDIDPIMKTIVEFDKLIEELKMEG